MEEQKLVLKDSVVEINFETEQVIVPEEELRKAGYVKLADDERMVKMVKLNQKRTQFMFKNGCLPFYNPTSVDSFWHKAFDYSQYDGGEPEEVQALLAEAYFNGYIVKEPKYYIKFPEWVDESKKQDNQRYLNINEYDDWELNTKSQIRSRRTQFTQGEIDKMQEDERAKGFNLDTLKVRVPDDELEN